MKKNQKKESTENEINFENNPNLGNVVKQIESKHNQDPIEDEDNQFGKGTVIATEDIVRTRKFKKALNSLGAR